jgi:hypothetical protein
VLDSSAVDREFDTQSVIKKQTIKLVFAAVVVYFLNNETMSKKLDTSLVIIKEPESDTVKINVVVRIPLLNKTS